MITVFLSYCFSCVAVVAQTTVATAVAKIKVATVAILFCGTSYSLAFATTVAVAVNNLYIEKFRSISTKKTDGSTFSIRILFLLYSLV